MIRRPRARDAAALLFPVVCAGWGCLGQIDGAGRAPGAGPSAETIGPTDPTPPPDERKPELVPPPPGPDVPGPTRLRRLSIREYNNTIRDLLGISTTVARDFGIDQDAGGFSVGAPLTTSADSAKIIDAAEQLASAAASKLPAMLPCGAAVPTDASGQATCARAFIEGFGRRAFRRPLLPEEKDDLFTVYEAHRGAGIGYAFPDAIRAVVAAVLASPYFLYRAEGLATAPTIDGGLLRFGPHEVASRLSYALWGSMPDDQLFKEADAGHLGTPEQIEAQARRMLKDDKARETIADFHLQWLEVEGLPKEPPKDSKEYTPALVEAMLKETADFTTELLTGPNATGSFEALLTSSSTRIGEGLAKLYGAANVTGPAARTVELDPGQRAGVLTQASFLAMHALTGESHPVRRGAAVLKRVLCTEVAPPPDMDVGQPKPPEPGVTTRERFAIHAKSECATCHKVTDPLGFAFESYDETGAFRTMEQGKPVDASGSIELSGGKIEWKTGVELVRALARTSEARECMTTQWLRYLIRRADARGDQRSLELSREAFARSSYDVRELLLALVKTRAFTHRSPSLGEVLP